MGSKKKEIALQVSLKGHMLPALGWGWRMRRMAWSRKCSIDVIFCLSAMYDRRVLKHEYRSRIPSDDNVFVHSNINKHNIRFKLFMFIVLMLP